MWVVIDDWVFSRYWLGVCSCSYGQRYNYWGRTRGSHQVQFAFCFVSTCYQCSVLFPPFTNCIIHALCQSLISFCSIYYYIIWKTNKLMKRFPLHRTTRTWCSLRTHWKFCCIRWWNLTLRWYIMKWKAPMNPLRCCLRWRNFWIISMLRWMSSSDVLERRNWHAGPIFSTL